MPSSMPAGFFKAVQFRSSPASTLRPATTGCCCPTAPTRVICR
jgi:hypothetical protein